MAFWYPEPIATDEGDAGDILHAQDARDGVEREVKPWRLGCIQPQRQRSNTDGIRIERAKELDGSDTVDLRAAAGVQDVVVRT